MTTPARSTPDVDPTPTGATALARWRSRCPSCSRRIEAGQPITRYGDGWRHETCAALSERIARTVAAELALETGESDR